MKRPEDPCRDPASEARDDWADADNLEGPGPAEAERRENYKAIQALTIPERFALMFGRNRPTSEIPLDTNPES